MKKEYWKPVVGYEGLYEVSNWGRVKSLNYNHTGKGKILKQQQSMDGYYSVGLSKNGILKRYYVHRLVAEAFLPNSDNLPLINHKDENKTNNNVDNLEWCDAKYNCNYGTRTERLSKSQINGKRSKIVLQYDLNGNFIKEWKSTAECGRNGYNHKCISKCCRGKLKTYKGFLWKYK